ncbi:hypothetical protein CC78DRAFT_465294 [Lojkania enalia]|uniref:Ankyrin n=1 Tax=Lojkania enalia TaxID=147567 RepID=A0A9P4K8H0_9PLEO|nr:hypothetical protein CC78DRAFT_465294 [Didymosphaeria enalia]
MQLRRDSRRPWKLLLEHHNIDINAMYTYGFTLLLYSIKWEHTDAMRMLLKHPKIYIDACHRKHGDIAPFIALRQVCAESTEFLLEPPSIDINSFSNDFPRTTLMYAIEEKHFRAVK